jgi:cellulose biosynthesis protein BcsQ
MPGKVSDTFCFWTNKGGVGKTTLCFHAATTYAQTHPSHQVILVDCDPQANLSATVLTQLPMTWNNDVKRDGREGKEVVKEKGLR